MEIIIHHTKKSDDKYENTIYINNIKENNCSVFQPIFNKSLEKLINGCNGFKGLKLELNSLSRGKKYTLKFVGRKNEFEQIKFIIPDAIFIDIFSEIQKKLIKEFMDFYIEIKNIDILSLQYYIKIQEEYSNWNFFFAKDIEEDKTYIFINEMIIIAEKINNCTDTFNKICDKISLMTSIDILLDIIGELLLKSQENNEYIKYLKKIYNDFENIGDIESADDIIAELNVRQKIFILLKNNKSTLIKVKENIENIKTDIGEKLIEW
jgi:hypothetical protein